MFLNPKMTALTFICIIQSRLWSMSVLMCVLISLHLAAAGHYKAKIDGALSLAICASSAAYSASQEIQPPLNDDVSKISTSIKTSCQVVQWATNCEPEEKCNTFECSASAWTPRQKGTRVGGGMNARLNEFPHLIYFKRPEPPPIFCGGTVLTSKYVVSAAHCFRSKNTSGLLVVAGAHDVKLPSGREQERQLKKVTVHEDYDRHTKFSDISVIEVDPPFDLTERVKPVVLPESNYVATRDFVVAGWAIFGANGAQPDILQKVTLPIVPYEECFKAYNWLLITSTMICAGYLGSGGKAPCQRDSGSPLVRKMANGSYIFWGIVSWSSGCGDPRYPGIYTEVAKFLDWIRNHTKAGC